jgi:hypothetical protein
MRRVFFHHIFRFKAVLRFLNWNAAWLRESVLFTSNSMRSPRSNTFSITINLLKLQHEYDQKNQVRRIASMFELVNK